MIDHFRDVVPAYSPSDIAENPFPRQSRTLYPDDDAPCCILHYLPVSLTECQWHQKILYPYSDLWWCIKLCRRLTYRFYIEWL